jgi:hypothetical protein
MSAFARRATNTHIMATRHTADGDQVSEEPVKESLAPVARMRDGWELLCGCALT